MEKKVQVAIIGGGPAGLAAAASCCESGILAQDILILERAGELGGILNQCIHNGFGLHTFKEELTGPEYAARFIEMVKKDNIPYLLNTMVIDLAREEDASLGLVVTAMNKKEGLMQIHTDAVILAMGCRERPRGALNIPGYRPAGIYTAGTAQRFVNLEGRMPGKEVVILGSGDIGLIMARRMTLEGANVKAVAEVMPYSGGLKRNIVQCLYDYNIPLMLSHTVVDIQGKERLTGVTIAKVDANRRPIPGTQEQYSCDTLLLSCGLIPENELTRELGASMNPVTNGPYVNESLESSISGVFACGNVLHVHDLVDYVTEEAWKAGENAAEYVNRKRNTLVGVSLPKSEQKEGKPITASQQEDPMADGVTVVAGEGVRYTVPSKIRIPYMDNQQKIRFRVGKEYRNVAVQIQLDGTILHTIKKRILAPGEMQEALLKKSELEAYPDLKEIKLSIVSLTS